MELTVTDNAAAQIKDMMSGEGEDVRLRFGIKGGGCSGLSYALSLDEHVNAELDVTDMVNGIPIVMFNQDIPIIEGTIIDFKQNMMGGGFSIKNPNAIANCGCGSSFKTDKHKGNPEKC